MRARLRPELGFHQNPIALHRPVFEIRALSEQRTKVVVSDWLPRTLLALKGDMQISARETIPPRHESWGAFSLPRPIVIEPVWARAVSDLRVDPAVINRRMHVVVVAVVTVRRRKRPCGVGVARNFFGVLGTFEAQLE